MKLKSIISLLIAGSLCGCSDYLDVVPDNIATIDMAFNNKVNAENIWLPVIRMFLCMELCAIIRD